MNIVSDYVFRVFITAMTAGVGGTWMVIDARRCWQLRNADRSDLLTNDKRFGYGMGVAIGVVAILGCLMFWNVI